MKTDSRVRYTKMVIKDSLLKLLKEKPVQKITVKEICQLAQINRATFYAHFRDPYDLLEQIENELFDDLSSTVITRLEDIDALTREIFVVIEKNIQLCQVLFSENGDKMFLRRIMDISQTTTLSDWHTRYPQVTQQQLDFLYAFIVSGSVAVIEQWVRTGMKETPLELGDIAKKFSEGWLLVQNDLVSSR